MQPYHRALAADNGVRGDHVGPARRMNLRRPSVQVGIKKFDYLAGEDVIIITGNHVPGFCLAHNCVRDKAFEFVGALGRNHIGLRPSHEHGWHTDVSCGILHSIGLNVATWLIVYR